MRPDTSSAHSTNSAISGLVKRFTKQARRLFKIDSGFKCAQPIIGTTTA